MRNKQLSKTGPKCEYASLPIYQSAAVGSGLHTTFIPIIHHLGFSHSPSTYPTASMSSITGDNTAFSVFPVSRNASQCRPTPPAGTRRSTPKSRAARRWWPQRWPAPLDSANSPGSHPILVHTGVIVSVGQVDDGGCVEGLAEGAHRHRGAATTRKASARSFPGQGGVILPRRRVHSIALPSDQQLTHSALRKAKAVQNCSGESPDAS